MSIPRLVVHTDVFVDHLCGTRQPSVLRLAMSRFFCYATVFQAMELFSFARSHSEVTAVEDSMAAMKILGVNAKTAKTYGALLARGKSLDRWNILVAGLCLESRLPLLTGRKKEFSGVRGLVLIPPELMARFDTGEEILSVVRSPRRFRRQP